MIYWQCKCGERQGCGSTGPRPCDWCPKCGTTLSISPEGHSTERQPHKLVKRSDEILERHLKTMDDLLEMHRGQPSENAIAAARADLIDDLYLCCWCYESKKDLIKKHEPWITE